MTSLGSAKKVQVRIYLFSFKIS